MVIQNDLTMIPGALSSKCAHVNKTCAAVWLGSARFITQARASSGSCGGGTTGTQALSQTRGCTTGYASPRRRKFVHLNFGCERTRFMLARRLRLVAFAGYICQPVCCVTCLPCLTPCCVAGLGESSLHAVAQFGQWACSTLGRLRQFSYDYLTLLL